jgi:hypothetical protein
MICVEVFRNGSRLCRAGVPEGTCLAWLTCSGNTEPPSPPHIELHVGALAANERHLDWIDANLDVGDEIVLRVREAAAPDPARSRHPVAAPEAPPSVDEAPSTGDRRESKRLEIFVDFVLRRIGPTGEILQEERTIAENVSRGGARVLTTLSLARGDVVEVEEVGGAFTTRAEVRGTYVGKDGLQRLNLMFEKAASYRLVWGDSDPGA